MMQIPQRLLARERVIEVKRFENKDDNFKNMVLLHWELVLVTKCMGIGLVLMLYSLSKLERNL